MSRTPTVDEKRFETLKEKLANDKEFVPGKYDNVYIRALMYIDSPTPKKGTRFRGISSMVPEFRCNDLLKLQRCGYVEHTGKNRRWKLTKRGKDIVYLLEKHIENHGYVPSNN